MMDGIYIDMSNTTLAVMECHHACASKSCFGPSPSVLSLRVPVLLLVLILRGWGMLSRRVRCHRFCPVKYPTLGDLLFIFLYGLLHIVIFACYFKEYTWEGGRKDVLMDIGVAVGHNMHVAGALHLTPVLRNSPIFFMLKKAGAPIMSHNYQVGWHIINGYLIFFLVTLHMFSFWADWIERGTEIMNITTVAEDARVEANKDTENVNRPNLNNGENEVYGTPTSVNVFLHNSFFSTSCFDEYGACLGEIAWLSVFLLVLLSQGCVRRSCYYLFLYTHGLFFVVFFIFACLHDPELLAWMVPSWVLYFIDWLARWKRMKEVKLIAKNDGSGGGGGEVGECAVYYVKNNQQYPLLFDSDVSGLFVYLNVPSVSKREWHPFSLCNGTKKGSADVIVRSHGKDSWTGRLVQLAGDAPIRAYASGTYGSVPCMAASDVAVYIAGGVGITALAPLVQSALLLGGKGGGKGGEKVVHVKKVVLIWAVREERDLDWFLEDIREKWLTSSNVEFVVKLFVTGESDGMLAAVGGGSGGGGGGGGGGANAKEVGVEMVGAKNNGGMGKEGGNAGGVAIAVGVPMNVGGGEECGVNRGRRPHVGSELKLIQEECASLGGGADHVDVFVCGPSGMRNAVLEAAAFSCCSVLGKSSTLPALYIHDETFEL